MNDRKKRFCEYYVLNFNGSESAIKAGYSAKTARQKAYELLNESEVQKYLNELKSDVKDKLEIKHEDITRELKNIAFGSIAKLFDSWTTPKDFNELTDEEKACIKEIASIARKIESNGEIKQIESFKIKLHDKLKALDMLGKHVGFYEIDRIQKRESQVPTIVILPDNGRE